MNYEPETPFQISEDSRMVYNLRGEPSRPWRTDRIMRNDVYIAIEARHFPTVTQVEIAQVICDALNEKYPVGLEGK